MTSVREVREEPTLHLGEGFTLPLGAVTETFAILAKRGSGKSYTAAVLVEDMLEAGLPVVVVDPLGVWWGLRSSADGKSPGYPVVIFGGDHADVPLEETAGALIADVLVDDRLPAVLDLSLLSKSGQRRFMADFLERLFHRNRRALHVVVDEADAFAPQRAQRGGERLLGAMEDLVRRGRSKGLGVSLISQRPAAISKSVLTQAEVLVALRMTGPRDVAAIDEWVSLHADEEQAQEVKRSLPSLPVGTAWFWSPGWLGLLRRIQVRRRRTYDSSATPKVGEVRAEPRQRAVVDLAALGARITATVERAQAEDPKALRGRVQQLERELAGERARRLEPVEVRVEVPVLAPEVVTRLEAALEPAAALLSEVRQILAGHRAQVVQQSHVSEAAIADGPRTEAKPTGRTTPRTRTARGADASGTASEQAVAAMSDEMRLKLGARRILETLARHHPMRVTRAQLGTLAHFKVTGGTFTTYWSQLKRAGLVDESGGDVGITEAGLAYVGAAAVQPMSSAEVLEQWRSALKKGAREMLDALVDTYPGGMTRAQLAEQVGMAVAGGTFGTYLSTLRRNGLVDVYGDQVRAGDVLFLEPRQGSRP